MLDGSTQSSTAMDKGKFKGKDHVFSVKNYFCWSAIYNSMEQKLVNGNQVRFAFSFLFLFFRIHASLIVLSCVFLSCKGSLSLYPPFLSSWNSLGYNYLKELSCRKPVKPVQMIFAWILLKTHSSNMYLSWCCKGLSLSVSEALYFGKQA